MTDNITLFLKKEKTRVHISLSLGLIQVVPGCHMVHIGIHIKRNNTANMVKSSSNDVIIPCTMTLWSIYHSIDGTYHEATDALTEIA